MRGAAFLLVALLAGPGVQAGELAYVERVPAGSVVVDARAEDLCAAASLPGARCIPAEALLGPHRRLASFRDILWLLGTAGLSGDEHVTVAGEGGQERDFLAGVLYLAGQRQVSVLTTPISRQSAQAPGQPRAMARGTVFQAPMRQDLLLLEADLAAASDAWLLDGRSTEEYWGGLVRGRRGGHLPGAESLPAAELRAELAAGRQPIAARAGTPVAYAHDAVEGIAYFTLLRAGAGVPAAVYAGGWAEWAADGTRPADAETHPDRPQTVRTPAPSLWQLSATLAAGALLGAAATVLTLRRKGAAG